jgi:NitT/TauT family transport system substrate-binding protein
MDGKRRQLIEALAIAGAATGIGLKPNLASAEPPPETKQIRLPRVPVTCWAPAYVAEDLLKAEGFSDVRMVSYGDTAKQYAGLASREIDIMMSFVAPSIQQIDAGNPLVVLGGVHPGCQELIASPQIRSVLDLKGKAVAVTAPNSPGHLFIAAFVGQVGLDPRRDIKWVFHPASKMADLLSAGTIDAFLVSPPVAQQMRAKKLGHVIVNTTTDRPWSQYFCCMVTTNREYMRRYPVATKRAMRAILKASHVCAAEPEAVARQLVRDGIAQDYAAVLQGLREVPYGQWRAFDAEDTVRYYALRLREAGLIKSDPRKIIAEGTDWRFLNELKKELKA